MLQGLKVIIADDDELSLEMLTTTLGGLGVQCTAVTNGKEALNALESNPDTDVMLLDLQMPVMDGFEVLSYCKADKHLRSLPIVVITSSRDEKLRALKNGASEFLVKPYELQELELSLTKLRQWRRETCCAKQAKNEFLTIASHELRTPLHQIIGLTELLNEDNLNNDQREIAEMLKNAADSMANIINDILEYTRLEHGISCVAMAPFSLRATINEAVNALKSVADTKGIRFEIYIADNVSDALIGPSFAILKIARILIENAVKFSCGGQIRVELREESLTGDYSRFFCSVSDQGIGISRENQEIIFEPFVQVDSSNSRKYQGQGLGLAIAQQMVKQIGGSINVQSDLGIGSTFNFSFHCNLQS